MIFFLLRKPERLMPPRHGIRIMPTIRSMVSASSTVGQRWIRFRWKQLCGFGRVRTGKPVFIRQPISLAIPTTDTCAQIGQLFRISTVMRVRVFLRQNSSPEICWYGIRIPSTAHPATPWTDVEPLFQSIGRRIRSAFMMFPASQVIGPPS